jgi:hypothetical protein
MKRAQDKIAVTHQGTGRSIKLSPPGCFNPLPSYQSVLEVRTPPDVLMKRAKEKIDNMGKGLKIGAPPGASFLPVSVYMKNLVR